jgi:hypothetical protein
MALRLRPLQSIDPLSVELPHGTEIITRVERIHGERRVPQGTIGRVTGIDGDALEITVVGMGSFRYERSEVSPRRSGQALFAQRRADAWDALEPCVVLETVVGSRAWGLANESSDEDLCGVFALPLPWTLGLVAPPEDLVSANGSKTYWAVGKAVRQALRADPNTLETLFLPARACDPIGEWLLEGRDMFVSREIFGSFGRYALGQLRRLEQALRLAEHRTVVLEWLRAEPALGLDALAEKLAKVTTTDAQRAKQYVKQLYRSLFDQGLLETNDMSGLARFARDEAPELDLPRDLRPKNAYNLIRLIATATHWLRTGTPEFVLGGSVHDELLAIKRGDRSLADVLARAEAMSAELEHARDDSPLPERADVAKADALLRRIGHELARRWIEQVPGPFGRDAPAAPEVEWMG